MFTFAIDNNGKAWFGHQYRAGGLGFIDDRDRVAYLTLSDDPASNEVLDVQIGPDGTLWLGTSGGLGRYRDGTFYSFGALTGLEPPRVWPVVPLPDRVYVGTIGGGVYVLSLVEAAVEMSNRHPWTLAEVGVAQQAMGHVDEAPAIYDELQKRTEREYVQKSQLAMLAANLGYLEETFDVLETAVDESAHLTRLQLKSHLLDP